MHYEFCVRSVWGDVVNVPSLKSDNKVFVNAPSLIFVWRLRVFTNAPRLKSVSEHSQFHFLVGSCFLSNFSAAVPLKSNWGC